MKRDEMAALGDELMMIARTLPDNVSKETCDKINKASIFLTELGKGNKMKRGEILDSVKKTITQDRNNRHGEPEDSFPMIAQKWTDYLRRCGYGHGLDLKPSDVAEMMALFKDCRFQVQPENQDNKHDQIGYLAIAVELRANENKKNMLTSFNVNSPELYVWEMITQKEYDDLATSETVDELYTTERFPVPGKHQLLTMINQATGKVMRYASVPYQQRLFP